MSSYNPKATQWFIPAAKPEEQGHFGVCAGNTIRTDSMGLTG